MRLFVEFFRSGKKPRETFVDCYCVNGALVACFRYMESGRWEPIQVDADLVAASDRAAVAR